MPQSMWKRTVLAAAVALALGAGMGRAQDAETTHPFVISPNEPHPVLRALHVPLPLGCWASHNGYSCGSFQSEATFVFGSCRAFYGEPCLKGPPPPPWSPEASVPPGPDGAEAAQRCRHCGW